MSDYVQRHLQTGADADGHGWQLQLLGSWLLSCDGCALEVPVGTQRVLTLLALRGPMTRTNIAGVLWPDVDDRTASGRLRTMLWRLADGRELVRSRTGELLLAATIGLDVDNLRDAARSIEFGDDDVGDTHLLETDLLPGWYDDWLVVDRERIRQVRLHALESLSGIRLRQGRHADAVDTALAAVACEPLRESAHRAVVRAHLAQGNKAEAHRHFARFRQMLRDELGVAPSEQFFELLHAGSKTIPAAAVPTDATTRVARARVVADRPR